MIGGTGLLLGVCLGGGGGSLVHPSIRQTKVRMSGDRIFAADGDGNHGDGDGDGSFPLRRNNRMGGSYGTDKQYPPGTPTAAVCGARVCSHVSGVNPPFPTPPAPPRPHLRRVEPWDDFIRLAGGGPEPERVGLDLGRRWGGWGAGLLGRLTLACVYRGAVGG